MGCFAGVLHLEGTLYDSRGDLLGEVAGDRSPVGGLFAPTGGGLLAKELTLSVRYPFRIAVRARHWLARLCQCPGFTATRALPLT
jgi:hypothetical protein